MWYKTIGESKKTFWGGRTGFGMAIVCMKSCLNVLLELQLGTSLMIY